MASLFISMSPSLNRGHAPDDMNWKKPKKQPLQIVGGRRMHNTQKIGRVIQKFAALYALILSIFVILIFNYQLTILAAIGC